MNANRILNLALRYGMRFLARKIPNGQTPEQQKRSKTARQVMKVTRRMGRF